MARNSKEIIACYAKVGSILTALDIKGNSVDPAYAIAGGTIEDVYSGASAGSTAGVRVNYGNMIALKTANGYFVYAHLSKINIEKGSSVKAGDKIGEIGATGLVNNAAHLHISWLPNLGSFSWNWADSDEKNALCFFRESGIIDYSFSQGCNGCEANCSAGKLAQSC